MRTQTLEAHIIKQKVSFQLRLPSEDKYEYTLRTPNAGNSEGWYHFNPDEITVEQAKEELLNAILRNNRAEIQRLDDLQLPLIIALQGLTL